MSDLLDNDGYPTPEAITKVEALHSMDDAIELLTQIWHWRVSIEVREFALELHTGGWSGNEEVAEALQESPFWIRHWWKTERGGHYYFKRRP